MAFDYDGNAAGVDQLVPLESAFPIFTNSGVPFFTGVGNDGGDFRTIAATFEFGGLVDGETTKAVLLDSIIHFLVDTEDLSVNEPSVPLQFSMSQNYPNPFNPTTTIQFSVATHGGAFLQVFDITGRLVTTLLDEELPSGKYSMVWDASNVASGIYIYKLTSGGETLSKIMILLK
jgi:hypothetical protein